LLVLVPYACLLIMLVSFQRSLIYFPTREAQILPEDAGFVPGRVEAVTTTAADGQVLNGWLLRADGDAGDRAALPERPLVLYFSGNAGNRLYRAGEIAAVAQAGADVLLFDYRGYGDNSGSPSEEGLAADARAVWQFACDQRNIPPGQIILLGESLGGGVATRLAAEMCQQGTAPGGLILRSTFSSLADAGAYHYPWLPVRWFLRDRFASRERIPAVVCPICVIHGSRDSIVPTSLGRQLFEAAPGASQSGIAKQFVELEGADHNDILYVAADQYRAAIRSFLQNLAGIATAAH
jgi:fermentation-respiration switch protein FrsA (DUF1100 family)